MNADSFVSERQEKLFQEVLRQLERLGYRDELLRQSYEFPDWFEKDTPLRVAPAAAFGRTPRSYESACFGVLLANGKTGVGLVSEYRALGAPIAFEVRDDSVTSWTVGQDSNFIREELHISPEMLDRVFQDHESEWSTKDVLRLKNIRFERGPQQQEFDLGLIPALEKQIQEKLHDVFQEVLADAVASHKKNLREVVRLVFRFVAAKVLCDRGHPPFSSIKDFSDADSVLRMVGEYYGEREIPLGRDSAMRHAIGRNLWSRVDFRNISVEVLAYIYENTFVDAATRQEYGTHSTPHNIARYIVHHLPFEKIGEKEPLILEPFSGHGIFLVAALQRLRELLPNDMDERERHKYFVKRLIGYEIDEFAVEVGTLCLMLADFPNHNGWQLHRENVFESIQFPNDLRRAGVVLCNPPFEDFRPEDRHRYGLLRSVLQPVEFMHRVLDDLSPAAMLGFVLPRAFLDGSSYREIRELLARRFDELETVGLPDRVFHVSQQQSALLLARSPTSSDRKVVSVTYTHVSDKDREAFLSEYAFTRRDSEVKSLQDAQERLTVVPLREIWDRLLYCSRLGTIAEIHRGVEWQPPFDATKYTSTVAKPGFVRGVLSAEDSQSFQMQAVTFLCAKSEYRRRKAWNYPWERPKTLLNAVRVSRGPWCLAAFGDHSGLIASQDFQALWPKNHWTPETLAAVLNGPVANAFVISHELDKRHNRIKTLKRIPTPELSKEEVEAIDSLVVRYVHLTRPPRSTRSGSYQTRHVLGSMSAKELPLFGGDDSFAEAKQVLLEIDAIVLKAYHLPPRLEREVLDFFRGADRPVPFIFREYFPESFVPAIPLWMYLSPSYKNNSAEFFLQRAPAITDQALIDTLKGIE